MAEFVMARFLQHAKYLRKLDEAQAAHRSEPLYGLLVEGLTFGMIGYGSINREVAVRAKAFGMTVVAMHRSATAGEQHPLADEVVGPDDLYAMLGRSDVVCAAVPDTPETVGMIDEKALAAMKPGAVFCNVGRGTLVDEAALIRALERGHLGAAILDVTVNEPVLPDDPLWDAPNLYLSPHCSTAAGELYPKVHRLFRENLARYVAGEPLVNEVDLTRGY
jgi:phosphoglycerate dehydrogenase-like enzyme